MPALESLPGKIGPYRLLEKIGEGGMGVVYLARDAENRTVAVKVLGPSVAGDPDARRRLAREVDTMRRVRSPYVAEILDADVTGPSPYIATRYVNGRTLDAVVRADGPLRGAALDRLAAGLAAALAAIHAAGVIHRDLKPGNVMLDNGEPVVIDFGIAHISDALTKITQTGMVMGTPGYLAPEVIEGKPSTGAADVHAWGSTVAFAATGQQPYGTGTFQTVFFRVLQGKADLKGVPDRLMPMVGAALSVDPRDRPAAQALAYRCGSLFDGVRDGFTIPDDDQADRTRMDAARMDGTRIDGTRLDGTRIAGARAQGGPPAPVGYGYGQDHAGWQRRRDYDRPLPGPSTAAANVADLLPPAAGRYSQRLSPEEIAAERERARRETAAGRDAEAARIPEGAYTAVIWALGAIAIALSFVLPVAGTLIALGALTLLRAADYSHADMSARGRVGAGDILFGVLSAPLTIARSLLATITKVPFGLLIAIGVALVSTALLGANSLPMAFGWGAAAAVAWLLLGRGARRPRRQLRRITHTLFRSRPTMTVAVFSLSALALATVFSAASQAPIVWPATSWMLPGLPSLGNALHAVQSWLLGHTVGVLHVP
jgi:hypothetical protein